MCMCLSLGLTVRKSELRAPSSGGEPFGAWAEQMTNKAQSSPVHLAISFGICSIEHSA
jgi:hypothetical protein